MTYEILQDGIVVAAADDPRDALHYAVVYSQDAPVTVRDNADVQTLLRRPIVWPVGCIPIKDAP